MALLWRKDIAHSIKVVTGITSKRICAAELTCQLQHSMRQILVINVYFPIDNRRKNHVHDELLSCYDAIDQLMERYPHHLVIIGGDLNADERRNNAHDKYMKHFCNWNKLQDVWSLDCIDHCDTYIDFTNDSVSCIDRFLVNDSLVPAVIRCSTIQEAENPSNHLPVALDLAIRTGSMGDNSNERRERRQIDLIAWHKVNDGLMLDYQKHLRNLIANISYPH